MTDHTHVRDADVHYVDSGTCAHRLLPATFPDWGRALRERVDHVPQSTHPAAQCPTAPEFLVTGIPVCGGHVATVVRDQHARGNPDPVVRRWV